MSTLVHPLHNETSARHAQYALEQRRWAEELSTLAAQGLAHRYAIDVTVDIRASSVVCGQGDLYAYGTFTTGGKNCSCEVSCAQGATVAFVQASVITPHRFFPDRVWEVDNAAELQAELAR
ncbi:MAG: hypothetical protein RJA49_1913 [Actinomycetota bacterium]